MRRQTIFGLFLFFTLYIHQVPFMLLQLNIFVKGLLNFLGFLLWSSAKHFSDSSREVWLVR